MADRRPRFTDRDLRMFVAIASHWKAFGRAPLQRELARFLKQAVAGSLHTRLTKLQRCGLITTKMQLTNDGEALAFGRFFVSESGELCEPANVTAMVAA